MAAEVLTLHALRRLPQIMQQERIKNNQKQRLTLTKAEIEGMPESTVMYRAVGKA